MSASTGEAVETGGHVNPPYTHTRSFVCEHVIFSMQITHMKMYVIKGGQCVI